MQRRCGDEKEDKIILGLVAVEGDPKIPRSISTRHGRKSQVEGRSFPTKSAVGILVQSTDDIPRRLDCRRSTDPSG